MSSSDVPMDQLRAALDSVSLQQPSHPDSDETPLYLCQPHSSRTLVQGKLRNICLCPPHVDRQEWIASHRAASHLIYTADQANHG